MTKEEFLQNRKLEWLKEERRDFINAYTEEWESDGWMAEWEKEEPAVRAQWLKENPDETEEDWKTVKDEAFGPFTEWLEERREALRDEAKDKWRAQEAEYESQWEAYVKDNEGALLKEFATLEAAEQVRVRRHWNDHKIGSVSLASFTGLHWDSVSGGVQKASPQPLIHGYVSCTDIDGEVAHSGTHGPCPHEIKVCVVEKDNDPTTWQKVLQLAGPKPL